MRLHGVNAWGGEQCMVLQLSKRRMVFQSMIWFGLIFIGYMSFLLLPGRYVETKKQVAGLFYQIELMLKRSSKLQIKQSTELATSFGRERNKIEIKTKTSSSPPLGEWLKLNTDVSVKNCRYYAAIGAVLRDNSGKWLYIGISDM